ncbi:hypothetical protein BV20DRAFT_1113096 [Pilatotrama ljubarskyi]|nr:hypothetical protein BV20DRAFT_1113096 [Pilatotrama ljubarskyi]
MSSMGDGRRLSGNLPLTYDVSAPPSHRDFPAHSSWYPMQRQQPAPYTEPPLPIPPAPPTAYPYYDRFAPEEPPAPPSFREGYTNEYDPHYWRTDREYFPPAPSPERYRTTKVEPWPRPASWQEPEPAPWPERPPVRDPYGPQWNRPAPPPPPPPPREAPATRTFEPSATWKQSHTGPAPYPESFGPPRERPVERFPEPPIRDFRERPVEPQRPREVFSPPQPARERYRPYSPPPPLAPPSAARNRFPYVGPRPDNHRPAFSEPEWAPEDDDLYADRADGSSREPPPMFSARSGSKDRGKRRFRGRESTQRSVSPVSPRPAQRSSTGYTATAASIPKRESPELPHLQPLPPKPYTSQPLCIPLGLDEHPSSPRKPGSLSPSQSSTASPSQLPHVSGLSDSKNGLPPKPPPQTHSSSSAPSPHPVSRSQTKSPALQITSVAQVSPGADSMASTPCDERAPGPRSTAAPSQSLSQSAALQQKPAVSGLSERPAQASNGWKNGRLSYLQRAPSFVPSTLAIDKKLKFPDTDATENVTSPQGEVSSRPTQPGRGPPLVSEKDKEDEDASDMEMSLPASPVRSRSPAALSALDVVSEVKGLREREEARSSGAEEGRVASEEAEEAADDSDMDMSPPASPVLAPAAVTAASSPSNPPIVRSAAGDKSEATRPTLSIDTSVASPQMSRAVPRKRAAPSSTASTPESRADESDMEMSSPTSSAAPSPMPTSPMLVGQPAPKPSLPSRSPSPAVEKASSTAVSSDVGASSAVAEPPLPLRRDAAVSPLVPHATLKVPQTTVTSAIAEAMRDVTQEAELSSVSTTPRIRRTTASVERPHVEAGELSPPASEETLREEAEGAEKDSDASVHLEKEPSSVSQKHAAPSAAEQAMTESEKAIMDIPLSEALRMVVRLRMLFPRQSREDLVDPIILSNRHIAEPEDPREPEAEALVQSVTEKEQQQLTDGGYDGTKHSLRKRFAEHRAALAEKVERLRKEYLALHEKWLVHCAKLDDVARANALEEAAATAGRTTRRSAAMGDAVRTDLEMEQILASLGNEELTDANHLSAKNAAAIPDMLSVTKGRVDPIFDDTNNLVEDPHSFYALETGIDDWTEEEKAIFIEKYAMYPKQFGIIAEYLPHKTPAQCVTFYYLHKNTTIDFRKVVAQYNTVGKRTRRGRGSKQKGNALLADILKHDDELSRDSTPNTSSGRRRRGLPSAPPSAPTPAADADAGPSTAAVSEPSKRSSASRRSTTQNTPVGTPTPDPEPAPKRPRRRANPTPKAAAAMGQEDGDDIADEDVRPAKRTRKSRKSKAGDTEATTPAPAEPSAASTTPAETKFIDQTEMTARKKSGAGTTNWSDEDKALFLKLLAQHGDDFKRIAASMPNKTTIQVTSFYKANLNDMELAKVAALAPNRSPTPSRAGLATSDTTAQPSTPAAENGVGAGPSNPEASSGKNSSSAPSTVNSSTAPPRQISVDAIRAHFQAAMSSSGMPKSPPIGGGSRASGGNGTPPAQGAAAVHPPTTLTTTFPSFSYSNLGPSNFAGGQPPPSAFARLSAPQPGPNGQPVMLEFSDFAQQPWMSGPYPGQSANGSQIPGLPAALETTEDLVRYLEHRTRLTAGQNNDSDFM